MGEQMLHLARGLGKGEFNTASRGAKRKKANGIGHVNLASLIGEKVTLNNEDAERVCVRLYLKDYIAFEFIQNAYSINSYVKPGPFIRRLTRFPKDQITLTIMADLQTKKGKGKKKGKRTSSARDTQVEDLLTSDDEILPSNKIRKKAKSEEHQVGPSRFKPFSQNETIKIEDSD